ncbi:hypothetical protein [Rubrimonas cliftonensis]|uniref:Uncharacterized protein n=1 Tax=Rubrimonas cliftonensis TaxID=89524 RepID=A0A1H4G826_9RHOB|nr:hypothetical protein [Rubrimonas cliftonensis]SEB05786.1 hypothetical protein SAMN05444370_1429 [Rubrimonas cliftonensis]
MAKTAPSAITRRSKRRKRAGFVRVEVQVRMRDAGLIREIASALRDPAREAEMGTALRERLGTGRAGGFEALLAAAPLEGLEFYLARDWSLQSGP